MVAVVILGLITSWVKHALIAVDWAEYIVIRVVEVVVAMELRIQPPGVPVVLVTVIRPHHIQQLILAVHVAEVEQDLSPKLVLPVTEIKFLQIHIVHTL